MTGALLLALLGVLLGAGGKATPPPPPPEPPAPPLPPPLPTAGTPLSPPLPTSGTPSSPSAALPYATPVRGAAAPMRFHWGVFGWSAAVLGIWLAIMLVVVPRFTEVFADFKLELGAATRLLFGVQRVVAAGAWAVVPVVPVVLGFASARMSPGGRRAVRMLMTLLFAALVLLAVLGILMPLTSLIGGMTSGGSSR